MSRVISDRLCKLFSEFHKRFPSGGFLHIVTDDGNWETEHIVWCLINWKNYCDDEELKWIEEHEREVIEMCGLILDLTEKQRYKIWGEVEKFNRLLDEKNYGGNKDVD
jgi:hypothetical protein